MLPLELAFARRARQTLSPLHPLRLLRISEYIVRKHTSFVCHLFLHVHNTEMSFHIHPLISMLFSHLFRSVRCAVRSLALPPLCSAARCCRPSSKREESERRLISLFHFSSSPFAPLFCQSIRISFNSDFSAARGKRGLP